MMAITTSNSIRVKAVDRPSAAFGSRGSAGHARQRAAEVVFARETDGAMGGRFIWFR